MEKIYILIPAYNEAKKITLIVQALKQQGYHKILVVDDGSTDQTKTFAQKAGAEVLTLIINRGQGAALRAGIEYLQDTQDPDIIITFDADGQHQPHDIKKFVQALQQGNDIVLGSRFLTIEDKDNIPTARKIILKIGTLFTNMLSGMHLTDTHNGFRALGRKAIHSIQIIHRKMEHASDILDEISKKKLKYTEVPVHILYTEYSMAKGQKTSNFIKIGVKMLIHKFLQ